MPSVILSSAQLAEPFAPPPPKVTGPSTKKATRPSNPLPSFLTDGSQDVPRQAFDPAKHLCFETPSKILTMKEIGLAGHGISPNAVSQPFPLFTAEAIKQIRAEIFSPAVLKDCQYESSFNKNMIRGMGRERAPFTYAAMTSDAFLESVSRVAGIDLVPAMDYEIANINIATDDGKGAQTSTRLSVDLGDIPAVAWHYDSYPFVCVTMLSDCTDMVGGETVVRTDTGDIRKVRGPAEGYSVVLQGRYIEHQALRASGGRERITMVTSFRPKSPFVRDETVMVGVRPVSNLDELYGQYAEYRLEILAARIEAEREKQQLQQKTSKKFDLVATRRFLLEQQRFIESMLEEMRAVE